MIAFLRETETEPAGESLKQARRRVADLLLNGRTAELGTTRVSHGKPWLFVACVACVATGYALLTRWWK